MDERRYPKWVGAIFGLLLSGSAHFIAGDTRAALKWYFGISLTGTSGLLILALPGTGSFIAASALLLVSIALWVLMLKQSYRPLPRFRLSGWIGVIVLVIISNIGWQYISDLIVHPYLISTESMVPTLIPGDRVMAERVTYRFSKPKRGDVVLLSTDGLNYPALKSGIFYIKRIAGLPGESIRIQSPHLVVNGEIIKEPAIFTTLSEHANGFVLAHTMPRFPSVLSQPEDKIVLGENQYLVLGDNTESSLDSRYYGPISESQIVGRVTRIYWPLSRVDL